MNRAQWRMPHARHVASAAEVERVTPRGSGWGKCGAFTAGVGSRVRFIFPPRYGSNRMAQLYYWHARMQPAVLSFVAGKRRGEVACVCVVLAQVAW